MDLSALPYIFRFTAGTILAVAGVILVYAFLASIVFNVVAWN